MSALKTVVQSMVKGLKLLTREVERMEELMDKQEKTQGPKEAAKKKKMPAARKAEKRAAPEKKAKKANATDAVLGIIQRSKMGMTTQKLKEKTGLSEKQIWNILNRLKKRGDVKSEKRGVYVKG
ncbi:MAG: hypothetical protein ABIG67_06280 [Pseudomonadota bacterium]